MSKEEIQARKRKRLVDKAKRNEARDRERKAKRRRDTRKAEQKKLQEDREWNREWEKEKAELATTEAQKREQAKMDKRQKLYLKKRQERENEYIARTGRRK